MGKWEDEIIGSSVNGMISIKLKRTRRYFKFANLESTFIHLRRRPCLRAETYFGVQARVIPVDECVESSRVIHGP